MLFDLKTALVAVGCVGFAGAPAQAVILATSPGGLAFDRNFTVFDADAASATDTIVHNDDADDVLYFRWAIEARDGQTTESYFNGLRLFEGTSGALGVGNSFSAFAYSTFGAVSRDLNSSDAENGQAFEFVEVGDVTTFVMKIDYNPTGVDDVTVFLNPAQAAEDQQLASGQTFLSTDMSFDNVLAQGGSFNSGAGWLYGEVIVTDDAAQAFLVPEPASTLLLGAGALLVFRRESRLRHQVLPGCGGGIAAASRG